MKGEKGQERVRENFLITRPLSDYLDLLNEIIECVLSLFQNPGSDGK